MVRFNFIMIAHDYYLYTNQKQKLCTLKCSYSFSSHHTARVFKKYWKYDKLENCLPRPLLNSLVEVSSVPWTQLTIPPKATQGIGKSRIPGGAAAAGPVCFVTILIVSFCHSNLDQINLIESMNDTGNHKLLPRLYRHALKKVWYRC